MKLKTDTKIATKNPDQNPVTTKPGTNHATSSNISALMISTNNPNVIIDSGSVSMTSSGLRNTLMIPSIRPAIKSDCGVANEIVSKTSSATHKESVLIAQNSRKRTSGWFNMKPMLARTVIVGCVMHFSYRYADSSASRLR